MISTEMFVREMIGVVGYAQQTLRLHPEQAEKVQRYLKSERFRLQIVHEELQDNLDITLRGVVY